MNEINNLEQLSQDIFDLKNISEDNKKRFVEKEIEEFEAKKYDLMLDSAFKNRDLLYLAKNRNDVRHLDNIAQELVSIGSEDCFKLALDIYTIISANPGMVALVYTWDEQYFHTKMADCASRVGDEEKEIQSLNELSKYLEAARIARKSEDTNIQLKTTDLYKSEILKQIIWEEKSSAFLTSLEAGLYNEAEKLLDEFNVHTVYEKKSFDTDKMYLNDFLTNNSDYELPKIKKTIKELLKHAKLAKETNKDFANKFAKKILTMTFDPDMSDGDYEWVEPAELEECKKEWVKEFGFDYLVEQPK